MNLTARLFIIITLLTAPCWALAQANLPHSARLTYLESNYGIPGSMLWQYDQNSYRLTLKVDVPFVSSEYQSSGLIDPQHGVRPLQFQEVRNGKIRRSASFDWDKRILSYGDGEHPQQTGLHDGAQDMLSLSWQLAFKGPESENNTQLTNGRKVYSYPIRTGQKETFKTNHGTIRAQLVQTHYDDVSVDVWLAADFGNVPIRIIFKKPGEPALDLQITSIELDGVEKWGQPLKQLKNKAAVKHVSAPAQE